MRLRAQIDKGLREVGAENESPGFFRDFDIVGVDASDRR